MGNSHNIKHNGYQEILHLQSTFYWKDVSVKSQIGSLDELTSWIWHNSVMELARVVTGGHNYSLPILLRWEASKGDLLMVSITSLHIDKYSYSKDYSHI